MDDAFATGLALGVLGGGYVCYWLGQVRAAYRGGRNTYRSVRGRR
ncbi:hypothetical protein TEK04_11055 [Klenkia sp. LSe6-5]|uniref:Uncharacterized protein n=1 Tax=Klenkia sesuvii TaxID=3103137 RepID=A0ABU8DTU9_9ACTN